MFANCNEIIFQTHHIDIVYILITAAYDVKTYKIKYKYCSKEINSQVRDCSIILDIGIVCKPQLLLARSYKI